MNANCNLCSRPIKSQPYWCLKCQKICHKECLENAYNASKKCPMCGKSIRQKDIAPFRFDVGEAIINRNQNQNEKLCPEHKKNLILYDLTCKTNLCILCKQKHQKCQILDIKGINLKINDLIDVTRKKINEINEERTNVAKEAMKVINKTKGNIEKLMNDKKKIITNVMNNSRTAIKNAEDNLKNCLDKQPRVAGSNDNEGYYLLRDSKIDDNNNYDIDKCYKHIKTMDNIFLYNILNDLLNKNIFDNKMFGTYVNISELIPSPERLIFFKQLDKSIYNYNQTLIEFNETSKTLKQKLFGFDFTLRCINNTKQTNQMNVEIKILNGGGKNNEVSNIDLDYEFRLEGKGMNPFKNKSTCTIMKNMILISDLFDFRFLIKDRLYRFKFIFNFKNYVDYLKINGIDLKRFDATQSKKDNSKNIKIPDNFEKDENEVIVQNDDDDEDNKDDNNDDKTDNNLMSMLGIENNNNNNIRNNNNINNNNNIINNSHYLNNNNIDLNNINVHLNVPNLDEEINRRNHAYELPHNIDNNADDDYLVAPRIENSGIDDYQQPNEYDDYYRQRFHYGNDLGEGYN